MGQKGQVRRLTDVFEPITTCAAVINCTCSCAGGAGAGAGAANNYENQQ